MKESTTMWLQSFITIGLVLGGFGLTGFATPGLASEIQHPQDQHHASGAKTESTARRSDVMKVGKKGTVTFLSPTRLGSHLLKPAEYNVSCEHTDTGHQLVFARLTGRNSIAALGQNETSDVIKASCRMEQLNEKTKRTELHLGTDESGQQYVKQVLIRGENVRHIF